MGTTLRLPPRFTRFALVGSSGVLVDMAILALLTGVFHVGLTAAKVVSFECATANNFCFNDRWTFGDIARTRGGGVARLKRFITYNAVCLGGLVLSVLLLNAQVLLLGIRPIVANAITIAIVTGWNFTVNSLVTWSGQPGLPQRRAAS